MAIIVRDATAEIGDSKAALERDLAVDMAPGLLERERIIAFLKGLAAAASGDVRLALSGAAYSIGRLDHHK